MALKTFKPYTKSTRGTILVDRTGLWKGKPFKTLVSPKNAMKGRNNNGHITSINRAGGHKKMYRHVDFYRKKFDMPATVERIEYDPNRSCYIMLVKFEDNSHAYYLAPQKIKIGDKINFDSSILDNCEITFTKNIETWNESSTMKIKYNNINYSIGEYQIHSNRDGVKFRFNRNNFHNLMEKINENKFLRTYFLKDY